MTFTTMRLTLLKGVVSVTGAIFILNTYTRQIVLLDTGRVKCMLA